MASEVFFAGMRARSEEEGRRFGRLFRRAGFPSLISRGGLTAIKVHFGERGCESFVSPLYAREVVDLVREAGGLPFLTDTATLYRGSRSNAPLHLETAIRHGFDYAVAGAPVVIADGLKGEDWREVPVEGRHFRSVKIASAVRGAESMIVLSHFKGHMLAGFGGALKNLGMGCAPPAGKMEQHCARAFVQQNRCIRCGGCVMVCPAGAASLGDEGCSIDKERCLGCGDCMRVCQGDAIEFDWEVEVTPFMERMVEYAKGAIQGKEERVGYINFLLRVTPDCDCVPWSDAPLVPDIGILASRDPVAIDHASLDLVNSAAGLRGSALGSGFREGEEKFRGVWPKTRGYRQIEYAEELGMGDSHYRLVEL